MLLQQSKKSQYREALPQCACTATRAFRMVVCSLVLSFTLLVLLPASSSAKTPWLPLGEGLALGTFPVADDLDSTSNIVVLRINPHHYRFALLTKSEFGKAMTPTGWAKKFKLTALINASMYLPDQTTSTGYMRTENHTNNARINKRFGAFFVAEPVDTTAAENRKLSGSPVLPTAQLLDRHHHNWKRLLPRYAIAIQNFRMISANGKNLWAPEGRAFSIAAIGDDRDGNILFIQCHLPLTVHQFAAKLQELPIHITKAMYVEGGSEASLHINSSSITRTWSGRHAAEFWTGSNVEHTLPNVLGIIKKQVTP